MSPKILTISLELFYIRAPVSDLEPETTTKNTMKFSNLNLTSKSSKDLNWIQNQKYFSILQQQLEPANKLK